MRKSCVRAAKVFGRICITKAVFFIWIEVIELSKFVVINSLKAYTHTGRDSAKRRDFHILEVTNNVY